MDKTQEEKFEKAYDKEFPGPCVPALAREYMRKGYEACLEANGIGEWPRIPEGYFKIGEEVEMKAGDEWVRGRIWATNKLDDFPSPITASMSKPELVRRIPAWKPRDGEAVLVEYAGAGIPGVYQDGMVYCGMIAHLVRKGFDNVKPFPNGDDWKDKPWSEI